MLVRPKDKDPKDCQSNVIYSYKCKEVHCNEEYIGESSRTLGERYREHLKEPSPIHTHSIQTGHYANEDNFSILGREDWGLTMLIKESMYIRINVHRASKRAIPHPYTQHPRQDTMPMKTTSAS